MEFMKKFTKLLEEIDGRKFFKVNVELLIPADSEGEVSYKVDSTLASFEEYIIKSVENNSEDINEYMELYPGKSGPPPEKTQKEQIKSAWNVEFGDRVPTSR